MTTQAGMRPSFAVDTTGEGLARLLPPAVLPARRDELLAALFQSHAPSSVLWQVSRLPPARVFTTPAEVAEAATARPVSVVEPW